MSSYQPYNHVSAWKSSDLVSKEHIRVQLEPRHLEAFDRALQPLLAESVRAEQITREMFNLDSIQDSVDEWIAEVQEGRGLLLLTGFPVDHYSKEECGMIYYGLGTHFGDPQSQSMMGDRLGHVVNVGGKDTRERAYRNSVELSLHTDASDIVGMMCLVKAKQGGMSGYCSGPAVYNRILEQEPELLDTLFEGYLYHLFGEELPGQSPVSDQKIPVFSRCEGYLSVSFLRSYIEMAFDELGRSKTDLEQRALDTFDDIAHSNEYRFDLMMEPGDIAFFNNYVVLHTRSEFFDDYDPEKRRHLLRLWLKAWKPRPLAGNISTYKDRHGIQKQAGMGTYYKGTANYVEMQPPET